MKITSSVKKRVILEGMYGATVRAVEPIEKPNVHYEPTPQLKVTYGLDDGATVVDWMPLKGYLRYARMLQHSGVKVENVNGYATVDGKRVEDRYATGKCEALVGDFFACCGIPDGTEVHCGEVVGCRVNIYVAHTETGKHYVKYHKKHEYTQG